jgi:hypothetical protein
MKTLLVTNEMMTSAIEQLLRSLSLIEDNEIIFEAKVIKGSGFKVSVKREDA